MSKAIRLHETGGPEVMRWEPVKLSEPTGVELRVRHTAIGLNYIDIYHRGGSYPVPLPSGLGVEAVAVVEAVGKDATDFEVGDRIVYAGGPPGAYASERLIPAARAIKLPPGLGDEAAASAFFKGLTVEYLIHRCYPVQEKDVVLWHAAAGGVGLLACQWLKRKGATVIGTVSNEAKQQRALAAGCTAVINYRSEDFVSRVDELTEGKLASVVYDSVGKDTIIGSINCLRPRGTLVSFGTVSGPTPEIDLALLGARGSLFATRASIAHYTANRAEFELAARRVFDALHEGTIRVDAPTVYPLEEVAQAHHDVQSGLTIGSVVLMP